MIFSPKQVLVTYLTLQSSQTIRLEKNLTNS